MCYNFIDIAIDGKTVKNNKVTFKLGYNEHLGSGKIWSITVVRYNLVAVLAKNFNLNDFINGMNNWIHIHLKTQLAASVWNLKRLLLKK